MAAEDKGNERLETLLAVFFSDLEYYGLLAVKIAETSLLSGIISSWASSVKQFVN